jgi:hypothetical protein
VLRPASIQYSVVLVVVCLPEFSACEISAVSTCACGTKRLVRLLLPAPEGPSTKVFFPSISGIKDCTGVCSGSSCALGLMASDSIW